MQLSNIKPRIDALKNLNIDLYLVLKRNTEPKSFLRNNNSNK